MARITTDRRQYPRFEVKLPLEIMTASGDILPATAINISGSGLELVCDRWTVHQVAPKGHRTTPDQNVQVDVRFDLPFPESPATVDVRCKVVVCRRFAEDEYRIGLQYMNFAENGFNNLENYLLARLKSYTQSR